MLLEGFLGREVSRCSCFGRGDNVLGVSAQDYSPMPCSSREPLPDFSKGPKRAPSNGTFLGWDKLCLNAQSQISAPLLHIHRGTEETPTAPRRGTHAPTSLRPSDRHQPHKRVGADGQPARGGIDRDVLGERARALAAGWRRHATTDDLRQKTGVCTRAAAPRRRCQPSITHNDARNDNACEKKRTTSNEQETKGK